MLEGLPKEVFWSILEQINSHDLSQLSQVSKAMHSATIPMLYKKVIIGSELESSLESIEVEPFSTDSSANRLLYVKDIVFRADFHQNLYERCIHFRTFGGLDVRDREGFEQGSKFEQLTGKALAILRQLKDESLKGFCWQIGTCIPEEIIGPAGYLPLKQTSLESIALITGTGCRERKSDFSLYGDTIDLSRFHSLRRISWIGLNKSAQLGTLRGALQRNSTHLTYLELEIFNRQYLRNFADDNSDSAAEDPDTENDEGQGIYFLKDGKYLNFFVRQIFGLEKSAFDQGPMFPALKSLSLASIPLNKAQKTLARALNVSMLSRLTLNACQGMENFLRAIATQNKTINLSYLEYICELDEDIEIYEALEAIFEVAPKLTDLFLSLPGPTYTLETWRSMADHGLPVTRFVYHQRTFETSRGKDLDDLSLLPDDLEWLENSGGDHPFARLNLTYLGLCAHSSVLRSIISQPEVTARSLKLLHIRKSGVDMAGPMERRGEMFQSRHYLSDTDDEYESDLEDEDEDDIEDDIEDDEDSGWLEIDDRISERVKASENVDATSSLASSLPLPNLNNDKSEMGLDIVLEEADEDDDRIRDENTAAMSKLDNTPTHILSLANWAFGPEGIPSLQVLAYGDFSFDGRFSNHNVLLCRNKTAKEGSGDNGKSSADQTLSFWPIRDGDIEMRELVADNMDFLAACPVDTITIK